MKLNYITFMVRDIEKTIDFYQNFIGLKLIRRFNPGMGEIAFMANSEDETNLEFIQFENVPKVELTGVTFSFKVNENLEELHAIAASKGYNPTNIINHPPKPAHFKVNDPDSVEVELSL